MTAACILITGHIPLGFAANCRLDLCALGGTAGGMQLEDQEMSSVHKD